MPSESEDSTEDINPSFADHQSDEEPIEGCYSLSVIRSRFHPSERLADEEIGYELRDLVDVRDIISATDHIAELLIENRGDSQFPGGRLADTTVYYGNGTTDYHRVSEETEIGPIDENERKTIEIPIGPPESPPLCIINFRIEAQDGRQVIIHPSEGGPSKDGITLKAPVVDRESLRILRELMDINSKLDDII